MMDYDYGDEGEGERRLRGVFGVEEVIRIDDSMR